MTRVVSAGAIRFDPRDGLVSAVVQDALDGRVLMVASMDAEALAATLASGEVHFHSRSRNSLWRKGETSGNVLRLLRIEPDCDGDALLVTVEPVGPTCHRGTRSCFDPPGEAEAVGGRAADGADPVTDPAAAPVAATDPATDAQGFAWLEELWVTLAERAAARPAGSYTADLLAGGVDAASRKVTEEATEVLLAAKDDATAQVTGADRVAPRGALAGESADLLYHLLVLLLERGLRPAEVLDVLRSRHRR